MKRRIAKLQRIAIEILKKYNIYNLMPSDVWQAFQIVSEKMGLPKSNGELIGGEEAEKLLTTPEGKILISRGTLYNKAKKGVITKIGPKFIKSEIVELQKIFLIKEFLQKTQVILPTEDISGKEVLAIIPSRIDRHGKGRQDQELEAVILAMTSDFVQDWIKEVTKSKNAKDS